MLDTLSGSPSTPGLDTGARGQARCRHYVTQRDLITVIKPFNTEPLPKITKLYLNDNINPKQLLKTVRQLTEYRHKAISKIHYSFKYRNKHRLQGSILDINGKAPLVTPHSCPNNILPAKGLGAVADRLSRPCTQMEPQQSSWLPCPRLAVAAIWTVNRGGTGMSQSPHL